MHYVFIIYVLLKHNDSCLLTGPAVSCLSCKKIEIFKRRLHTNHYGNMLSSICFHLIDENELKGFDSKRRIEENQLGLLCRL